MSITAMKQALEALEMLAKWEHPASNITTKTGRIYPQRIAADAADVLRVAMAEVDRKKPVAWATDLHFDADTEIIPAKQKGRLGTDGMPVPLFSGPFAAQRQWVGLTDEEISDLWCKVSNTDFVTADTHVFARAIEAAHGIKGEA